MTRHVEEEPEALVDHIARGLAERMELVRWDALSASDREFMVEEYRDDARFVIKALQERDEARSQALLDAAKLILEAVGTLGVCRAC